MNPSVREALRDVGADAGSPDRVLSERLGVREAELAAAICGEGAVRINPHPDAVIGAAAQLGNVIALTRNDVCMQQNDGFYDEYYTGDRSAMVLGPDIDLRIFPGHWRHAFMIERDGQKTLQVYDAAGDPVHGIALQESSDHEAWERLKRELALENQTQKIDLEPRAPKEAARSVPEKVSVLRSEWQRMTDTHQFLAVVRMLRMNRLGAYRIVGEPFARSLPPDAFGSALSEVQRQGIDVMVFTGNQGCLQIHTGRVETLSVSPQACTVSDRRFGLHLRATAIAEVWAVQKPTKRGNAVSLEAFDAEGGLIAQILGVGKSGRDSRAAWEAIVTDLSFITEVIG